MLGCVDQFLKVLLCFERSSVRACLFEKKRMKKENKRGQDDTKREREKGEEGKERK